MDSEEVTDQDGAVTNQGEEPAGDSERIAGDGQATAREDLWREYDRCAHLEQALVRHRWTFFTVLFAAGLVIGGIMLGQRETFEPLLSKAGFAFGYLIFVAGYYHYWWFHRKCHLLRDHLCDLERRLGIEVYIIREYRPRLWVLPLHYHWAIDVLAIAYTVVLIAVLVCC
jgi:hypothetical protein